MHFIFDFLSMLSYKMIVLIENYRLTIFIFSSHAMKTEQLNTFVYHYHGNKKLYIVIHSQEFDNHQFLN